jgi:hypothetical protein
MMEQMKVSSRKMPISPCIKPNWRGGADTSSLKKARPADVILISLTYSKVFNWKGTDFKW